jgi:hypothetical protein
MPPDPIHQLNNSACQADFSYAMLLGIVKIQERERARNLSPKTWKRF